MKDLLAAQLSYDPVLNGAPVHAPVLVCGGMGGSSFPVRIARFLGASPYLIAHQEYGLPDPVPEGAAYIALSYSGATEETLSFANAALERGLPLSVIAGGGQLLALAKEHGLPYVEVSTGLVPREAVVSMTKALLALIGDDALWTPDAFDSAAAEAEGTRIGETLMGAVPVFYASARNSVLPELAKILCNETAKIPAFMNVLPEANHNEMQGYGLADAAQGLTDPFVAIFFEDATDDARVARRMALMRALLTKQGVRTLFVSLPAGTRTETFLHGWWLSRALARALADRYSTDPDATPLIDAFKHSL